MSGDLIYDIYHYEVLDSTNSKARTLLNAGDIGEGAVITAARQTAGRGRGSNAWHSPEGNLYLSLVVQPDIAVTRITELSFVAAVAVGDSLYHLLPKHVTLSYKWPNDMLVDGRKIAGLLLESRLSTDALPHDVIIGIGMNIATSPEDLPYPTSHLMEHQNSSFPSSQEAVQALLLKQFNTRYQQWLAEGFSPIRNAWLKRAHQLHQTVTVNGTTGTFSTITTEGSMLLTCPEGEVVIHAL